MKILIASDTYYPNINGASYFTYRLATELVRAGHQVAVVFPSQVSRRTKTLHEGVTVYGMPSFKFPNVKPDFYMSPAVLAKKSVKKIVDEVKPDVIHIQNHFMIGKEIARVACKNNIPIVGTNHFMPDNLVHFLHFPNSADKMIFRFGWNQCFKTFDKLDFVTTPTQTARNLFKKAGFSGEVIVVSNGIDLEKFNPKNDGEYLRKMYGIPKNKPIMLYTGRLEKEKKVEQIIEAMPYILEKIPIHLVISGDGNLKEKLIELSRKLKVDKSITFTGFVADKDFENIYSIADIFVIAGIAELQSIVTMEAMASGLPVVGVDAMALPELIHDGENGFLFGPGDSRKLAENIITILSDKKLYQSMSKASLEIIRKHDIRRTIDIFEAIYIKAITNHPNTADSGIRARMRRSRKDLAIKFTVVVVCLAGIFSSAAIARAQGEEIIEHKIKLMIHTAVSESTTQYQETKSNISSKFSQDVN